MHLQSRAKRLQQKQAQSMPGACQALVKECSCVQGSKTLSLKVKASNQPHLLAVALQCLQVALQPTDPITPQPNCVIGFLGKACCHSIQFRRDLPDVAERGGHPQHSSHCGSKVQLLQRDAAAGSPAALFC